MTDRTVKVSLVAQVQGYISGMEKAAKATRETGGEAEKLGQKKEAFQQIGTAAIAMGAVAAAGVALAIKKFADFDAQMSQVQSLSHATASEMDQLRDASLNMGQAIGFSATQVADAETELVKAGVSVKDILGGGLVGALNLAAAGQIEVGKATEIAAVALTQFKLQGKDVPHVADLLAAGADKALGGVDQLGQALNQGGLVAAQFGLSVDDTVGTLSAFANAGLLGSDAGTSFKQMLLSLASPSQKAADTMKQYNIQAYDAQGNFVGITNLAGQLQKNLGGVSQAQRDSALSIIFGSDAIRTANVLYKEGSKGIKGWIDSVNDTGFAAEQARGKMDNLNGDLKKLGAAFDTALINTGSNANDVLRETVQAITGLVSAFGELPAPAQGVVLAGGAVVAAIGLIGGGALTLVPKLAEMKIALETLGTSMRTVSLAGGAIALVVAGLIQVFAEFGEKQAQIASDASSLAETLDKETGAITKNTREFVANKLAKDGTLELTKKLGLASNDVINAYLQQPAALKRVQSAVNELDKSESKYIDGLDKGKYTAQDLIDVRAKLGSVVGDGAAAMSQAKTEAEALAEAETSSADASDTASASASTAATAYIDAAKGAQELGDQISQLVDEINKANGVGQDAISTNSAYQTALAKVQDTIKKAKEGAEGYSTSLDTATAAGASNVDMFADLAEKSQAAAKAQFEVDHNSQSYVANLQAGRQALIDNITALGGTAAQAQAVADQVYRIPDEKAVKILADAAQAQHNIDVFNQWLASIPSERIVNIVTRSNAKVNASDGPGFATGGRISGPGTGTSDSIPIWASNGEYMNTAKAASNPNNLAAMEYMNRGGEIRGYAGGGQIQPTYVPASSFASAPTVTVKTSDRPIYMDGQLFGMLREMANGEAQIVVNANETARTRRARM
ncbi:phage tail tape measure protein [Leifsonia sp. 71-9]|uniref:phage tail tape measure protein n=1 Tax=Leifsonia sp. 71-9 TaxID=1895934 RepID=UPI0025BFEAD8|nr:phage tail tape measure protein [Leifsonia sp. 71-9]